MAISTGKHFITSLGTGNYEQLYYFENDKQHYTAYAPVAVAALKNLAGAKASILVTQKAREKHYNQLAGELTALGLNPQPVDIPDGISEEEIFKIFEIITAQVSEGERITLDVTFSLRHLPFVYLAALIYMVGLKQVKLEGIYYGAFELKQDQVSPILEITSLFRLIEWYHGLSNARQEGDFRALGRLLNGDIGRLYKQGAGDANFSKVSKLMNKLGFYLASVLPMEVGLNSKDVSSLLKKEFQSTTGTAYAAHMAMNSLSQLLDRWKISGDDDQEIAKGYIEITEEELERQLRLAEWYIERMNVPAALLVIREWMITRMQFASNHINDWLGYHKRKKYEQILNALSERAKHGIGNAVEKELASVWQSIAKQRNKFAHAGMLEKEVDVSAGLVKNSIKKCRALLEKDIPADLPYQNGDCYLITPLGMSKGVLYTALTLVNPNKLVIITSLRAGEKIPEIMEIAKFTHLEPILINLTDPHNGFNEVKDLVDSNKALVKDLALAGNVVANITGGTTAMQYAVDRLADEIKKLGTPVKKVALVDRRSYEEQQKNPYVCGEMVEL
ncbi:TIGR02221 family CRISPR-associated protein [Peptococcaceae bacterium 1198_IL3148]